MITIGIIIKIKKKANQRHVKEAIYTYRLERQYNSFLKLIIFEEPFRTSQNNEGIIMIIMSLKIN